MANVFEEGFSDIILPGLTSTDLESIKQVVDIDAKYSLPRDVKICRKCVMTNQRPRITFDSDGVCTACRYWELKETIIDWKSREEKFRSILNMYRSHDGSFDVIVPSSGGKDSSYVAYILKDVYDMHPLTVTWSPSIYTEIGYRNFQQHIHNGLDNICFTANGLVHRRLCRSALIEMGDPFQPFIYGQVNSPLHAAKAFDIGLIIDGENGETEYGGDDSTADMEGYSNDESESYWLSGTPVENWLDQGYSEKDIQIYQPPRGLVKVRRLFFSYFHNWQPQKHYYYVSSRAGFRSNPHRSEGTFSKYASLDDAIDPFHYYFGLLKFGIGRATSDAAHEIREGLLDRSEGLALVNKYDAESPSSHSTDLFMRYAGLTKDQLDLIQMKWTNDRIWGDNYPRLKF